MFIPLTPELERAPRTPYSQLTKEQRRKLDAIAKSLLEVRIPRRFYLAQLREFVDSMSGCFEVISDNQKTDLPNFTSRESREGNEVTKKEDANRKDVILFKRGRNPGVSNEVINLTDNDQRAKRRRMPQGDSWSISPSRKRI